MLKRPDLLIAFAMLALFVIALALTLWLHLPWWVPIVATLAPPVAAVIVLVAFAALWMGSGSH